MQQGDELYSITMEKHPTFFAFVAPLFLAAVFVTGLFYASPASAYSPPSCSLGYNVTVPAGSLITLYYSATAGSAAFVSCSINQGVGNVPCPGSGSVSGGRPIVNTTYTYSANDGTTNCQASATVLVTGTYTPAPAPARPSLIEIWAGFFRQLGGWLRII